MFRNSKSRNMTNSGENGLNIRTSANPKLDRTRCPEDRKLYQKKER